MVVCENLFSDCNANKSIWLVVVFPNIYLYCWFLFGFKKINNLPVWIGQWWKYSSKISFYILPTKLKISNVKLQMVDLFWQWQLALYGTEVIYNFWRRNNHFKLWRAFGLERKHILVEHTFLISLSVDLWRLNFAHKLLPPVVLFSLHFAHIGV